MLLMLTTKKNAPQKLIKSMYNQEHINPYNQQQQKAQQVEEMFNNIAPTYDRLNHHLSLNIDRYWRKKLLQSLKQKSIGTILDVATGTGDLAIQAATHLNPDHITGIDLSEEMLKVAVEKTAQLNLQDKIFYQKADCLNLPMTDNSFDAVIAAFGIRNFQHLDEGLKEMHRVLKPGGQIAIIELTQPIHFPMRQLFWIYSHTWLPFYGKLISKDIQAYKYLTATIQAFPQGETMMQIMQKAGFRNTKFKRLTMGICTLYTAEK